MYDGIMVPFECNFCGFKESNYQKMPRKDLWCTKDTQGVLDRYWPGDTVYLRNSAPIINGDINIYNECPSCKTMVYCKVAIENGRLTTKLDFGEHKYGKYYE